LAGTGPLTGMVANSSTYPWKWMIFFKQLQCFPVFLGMDQGRKALNTGMGRAGDPAGGRPPFADSVSTGNGLRIFFEGRLPDGKTLIIFIGKFYWADLAAFPATGAFGKIHKTGLLSEPGLEMSRFSFQSPDLGVGQDFNVQVPADLDQFGRDNSHGTVIGWKCFIQLGHQTADGR
jgi:hypothetical protein